MEMINAIGRRKTAVARVYLMQGEGKITVNGKDYREYFPQLHVQHNVTDPFVVVGVDNIYDLKINVRGGGFKGQAEAVRMGLSRALVKLNEEFKKPLKDKKIPHARQPCRGTQKVWQTQSAQTLPVLQTLKS